MLLLLLLLLLRCFDNFNDHNWFSPRSPWYFPHPAAPRQPPRAFILKYAALPPQTAHSCPTSTAHTPLPHSIQHPNPPHHLASKWLQHSTSLYGNNNQMFLQPAHPPTKPPPIMVTIPVHNVHFHGDSLRCDSDMSFRPYILSPYLPRGHQYEMVTRSLRTPFAQKFLFLFKITKRKEVVCPCTPNACLLLLENFAYKF